MHHATQNDLKKKVSPGRIPARALSPRAFTLVEMVFSMMISVICLTVTSGAIMVMARGGQFGGTTSESHLEMSLALQRLRTELAQAVTVSELTAAACTFTHPDMDGDDMEDAIRYAWTGPGPAPLTRSVNGNAAANVLENCRSFAFTAEILDPVEAVASDETGEQVIAYHTGFPGGYSYIGYAYQVTNSSQIGEYFVPANAGAVGWKMTRAVFYLSRAGSASGSVTANLFNANGSYNPTGPALAASTRSASEFPGAWRWQSFSFPEVELPLNQPMAIIVKGSNSNSAYLAYDQLTSGFFIDGMTYRYTSNSGSSWSPTSNLAAADLRFYVYGKYVLPPGNTGFLETGNVASIHASIVLVNGRDDVTIETGANLFNRPTAAGLAVGTIPVR